MSATSTAVLGAGSWGTAMAQVLAQSPAGGGVTLWARRQATSTEINLHRSNERYLPGVHLASGVQATTEVCHALEGASIVFVAVPTAVLGELAPHWSAYLEAGAVVVSLMKGLTGQGQRASDLLHTSLKVPRERICVLSGPNLAAEVAAGQPSAAVIASADVAAAARVAQRLDGGTLYSQVSTDVLGVELGAIAKNVVALATGMCAGAGQGTNAAAALVTLGFDEIVRLGRALGAQEDTFAGLAGLGDLLATCMSAHSRNYRFGVLIGDGVSVQGALARIDQTVEGVSATEALLQVAHQHGVPMPLAQAVHAVLTGRGAAEDLVRGLLGSASTSLTAVGAQVSGNGAGSVPRPAGLQ